MMCRLKSAAVNLLLRVVRDVLAIAQTGTVTLNAIRSSVIAARLVKISG